MIHEKELLYEFVADAKEHLNNIEDDFLKLEEQKSNPDKKIVDKVFRAIHSIKGAAGFFGLDKISRVSHLMETLLSMIRSGDIQPETHFIDGLLAGTDYLNAMLDNIEFSNDTDITDILKKLSFLLENKISSQVKDQLNTPVCLLDIFGDDIGFDINAYTLKNFSPDMSLFVLKYDLSELDRLENKRPVMLIRELLSSGEIIDAQIYTTADDLHTDISDTPLFYDVLYVTILSHDQLQRVTGLDTDRVIPVKHDKIKDKSSQGKTISSLSSEENFKLCGIRNRDLPLPQIESKTDFESISHLRIHTDIIDRLIALTGELVLVRNQKNLMINRADPVSRTITQHLDNTTARLQETIMGTRMQPLGIIFNKFPKLISQLEEKLEKKININISGSDVELDKTVLESLADPMVHLIRNSCDHGIEVPAQRIDSGKPETGNISIQAWHEAGQINIEIQDDGKGIDPEKICKIAVAKGYISENESKYMSQNDILSLIFMPGFSTTNQISEVSGRGVGMDVVKTGIEKPGGTLNLESNPGRGTKISISLPLTLAIIPCLIIKTLKGCYAVPQINVEELLCLYDNEIYEKIEYTDDQEIFRLRNTLLPLIRLSEVLKKPKPFTRKTRAEIAKKYKPGTNAKDPNTENPKSQSLNIAVIRSGSHRFGLIYDEISGFEEIVVKPPHPSLKSLGIYSGVTIMGDGKIALILNPGGIAAHAGIQRFINHSISLKTGLKKDKKQVRDILIFKSGSKERFALELNKIKRIEQVSLADIEYIKDKEFISIMGRPVCIMRLEKILNVSPCIEKENMLMLIPKNLNRETGVLISEYIDVVQFNEDINTETFKEQGVRGTGIIQDHMTLILDINKLIENFYK